MKDAAPIFKKILPMQRHLVYSNCFLYDRNSNEFFNVGIYRQKVEALLLHGKRTDALYLINMLAFFSIVYSNFVKIYLN